MNVRLLAYTQINEDEGDIDPETLLASEKRICSSSEEWEDIVASSLRGDVTQARIRSALVDQHMGLFEHLSFTFLIEGISRVCTHQLVRHRMASYLQMSQRTVDVDKMKLVIPPSAYGERNSYKGIEETLKTLYKELVDAGIPRDDVRYIMPHGMETRLVMTINGRALMHFLKLRLSPHAQWEIRELAEQMLTLVRDRLPIVFGKITMEKWE